ncbi:MAG: orotidine 5'-phosphate decarboxylase [Elusimicrobia bacterium RIFOXYA2_FULL_40_6]|nr:MAG: orotidine 5'-phosphate decarboxylase [Elusimicrobia bacterium RIFOXYA2_FULL_40_6]
MAHLVIALDVNKKEALDLVKKLPENAKYFKIGHKLFTEAPEFITELNALNKKVFLDLKYHDIPSVVGLAIEAVSKKYNPFAITLHTSGGPKMIAEAAKSRNNLPEGNKPLLFGVTILTSLGLDDLKMLFGDKIADSTLETIVMRLAQLAKKNGFDGIVCSGKELSKVKFILGKEFLTLVPGVQLAEGSLRMDQQRTSSIEEAAKIGDYLVVGRQITGAENPAEMAEKILEVIK